MRALVRVLVALAFALAAVVCADVASYATDCVGPDDPPGCTTPAPDPATPTATVTVTETPAPSTQDVRIVDGAVDFNGDARDLAVACFGAACFLTLLVAARVVHAWGADRG